MGDRLGLVIPTLNEEANIGALLDRVRSNLKSKANLRVGLDYLQLLGRLSRSAFSRSVGPS